MPRCPRTVLTLKRERVLKEIKQLNYLLQLKESELEEVNDIIREKGPFKTQGYFTITDEMRPPITQQNARKCMFGRQV